MLAQTKIFIGHYKIEFKPIKIDKGGEMSHYYWVNRKMKGAEKFGKY